MNIRQGLSLLTIGIAILIVLFVVFTCFYTVNQSEFAIIETFGKPSEDVIQAGLGFKLPYPIQKVNKVSRETFSLTFGYDENDQNVIAYEDESKMITGDENIILADLEVQWRVSDPYNFLYNNEAPVTVLYNAVSSALRGIVGSVSVDDVLTDGRAEIMNDVRDLLTQLVDEYELGISIVNVNLQDVDLPTHEVSDAFKKVTSAREERVTKINEANRYRNEKINTADGQKAALISKAEGKKVERIEEARGDVATFNSVYSEYVNGKEITKERLMIETLERILPNKKMYIMDDSTNSNTVKYLPIDDLKRGSN